MVLPSKPQSVLTKLALWLQLALIWLLVFFMAKATKEQAVEEQATATKERAMAVK